MANTMRYIVDVLIKRYESLLAQAEARGISVWDKKAELVQLKKKLSEIKEPEPIVAKAEKPKKQPKQAWQFPETPNPDPLPETPYPDNPIVSAPEDKTND